MKVIPDSLRAKLDGLGDQHADACFSDAIDLILEYRERKERPRKIEMYSTLTDNHALVWRYLDQNLDDKRCAYTSVWRAFDNFFDIVPI